MVHGARHEHGVGELGDLHRQQMEVRIGRFVIQNPVHGEERVHQIFRNVHRVENVRRRDCAVGGGVDELGAGAVAVDEERLGVVIVVVVDGNEAAGERVIYA